jgi:hypothetical protein
VRREGVGGGGGGGGGGGLDVTILTNKNWHLGWAAEETWGSSCRGYVGSVSVLFSCRGYVVSFAFGSEGEKERGRSGSDVKSNSPNLKGGEQTVLWEIHVTPKRSRNEIEVKSVWLPPLPPLPIQL